MRRAKKERPDKDRRAGSVDIVGRDFIKARGGFPLHTVDFQLVDFSSDDMERVGLMWWLFKAYFFHVETECVGTRAELALMAQLVTRHIRDTSGAPPIMRVTWPYNQRVHVEAAYARLARLFDRNGAGEGCTPDEVLTRHLIFATYMQPVLRKLSDEALYRTRQHLMPSYTTAIASYDEDDTVAEDDAFHSVDATDDDAIEYTAAAAPDANDDDDNNNNNDVNRTRRMPPPFAPRTVVSPAASFLRRQCHAFSCCINGAVAASEPMSTVRARTNHSSNDPNNNNDTNNNNNAIAINSSRDKDDATEEDKDSDAATNAPSD